MNPQRPTERRGWKSWLEAGLGFFYPEVCQYCGNERATALQGFIGENCRQQTEFIAAPMCERCGLPFAGDLTGGFACANCRDQRLYYDRARSAVVARGLVLEILHRYKYHRALWAEPFLADLLVAAAGEALRMETWDVIVPVPLHPLKEQEREFNQAARLARRLAQATGIPVATGLLRRVAATPSQTHLSREGRAANVRHAFALRDPAAVRGQRVVLIDDVFTTGATTNACARLLRKARARSICVWTVARGVLT